MPFPTVASLFPARRIPGHETAQAALRAGEVDATFFFPLDVPLAVKRTLRAVRPNAFLLLETELWPNVLHLARRQGARTFLVNGRVSDNLLKRAPQMRRLWRWMMANLDGLLMRSQFDAATHVAAWRAALAR
jgi:3-deoxy-D-manno-octulosonic-acid transferase